MRSPDLRMYRSTDRVGSPVIDDGRRICQACPFQTVGVEIEMRTTRSQTNTQTSTRDDRLLTNAEHFATSRGPMTGERRLFGEYLAGHLGADLIAGTKTPDSLSSASSAVARITDKVRLVGDQLEAMRNAMPGTLRLCRKVEFNQVNRCTDSSAGAA